MVQRMLAHSSAGASFILVSLVALLVTLVLRTAGAFGSAELALLDHRIMLQQSGEARHVAVVLEQEDDLKHYGYPLPDGTLAEAIERLLNSGALGVAVDKFRDAPVPPGSEDLRRLLRSSEHIVWVTRLGGQNGTPVPAPETLLASERAGCADLVPDQDGVNRRALLAQESGAEACVSLSLASVVNALLSSGERAEFNDSNSLSLGRTKIERLWTGKGSYKMDDLGGFQIALSHPVSSVPSLSLKAVLDKEPIDVKGRLVFIGSAADSLGDMHLVPDSRGAVNRYVPGVVLHARIAEELMRNARGEAAPVRHMPLVGLLVAAFALAAVGARAGVLSPSIVVGAMWSLFTLLGWLVAVLLLDWQQWRVEAVAPAFSLMIALGLGWARRVQLEQRERAQLRDLFSRQVSTEVASAIWEQRDSFFREGRVLPVSVQVTVLFADLRGFTSITENLERDPMVDWLNGAVACMTEAVMEHGGVVTRFGGDQVMAVFGVPIPRESSEAIQRDATQALHAALRMETLLRELNQSNQNLGLPAARVRIGIQSGTALQCGVGSKERFEFTVLGDAVNTASRLESLPGEDDGSAARIFAGGDTIALCGKGFVFEPVAELKLKGKNNPVAVFRVRGEVR